MKIFIYLIFSIFISTSAMAVVDANISQELQDQFKSLNGTEQSNFLEKRSVILNTLESGLKKSRWVFYLTDLISTGLVVLKNSVLYDSFSEQPSDEITEMVRIDHENNPEKYLNKKISARVDEKIKSVLRATDLKLWSQSPLVASANQFSFLLAAEIQAEGGNNKHQWGGLYDLGLSVGYNSDTKSAFIQIFRNREKFESSILPAFAVGGLVFKAGPMISQANENTEMHLRGESFYPPLVPGFQSTTKESYAFGFSTGLTLPPPPFGDMLTYTNSLDQKVLIKISFSRAYLGFVRVKTNLNSDSIKFVQEKFSDFFKPRPIVSTCRALF